MRLFRRQLNIFLTWSLELHYPRAVADAAADALTGILFVVCWWHCIFFLLVIPSLLIFSRTDTRPHIHTHKQGQTESHAG